MTTDRSLCWPTRHRDGLNTDYYPLTGPRSFRVRQRLLRNLPVATFIAVDARRRMYALTLNSCDGGTPSLWCFDEHGELRWTSRAVQASLTSIAVSPEGQVYVADGRLLRCFDAEGQIRWGRPLEEETAATLFLSEDEVLVLDIRGYLHVVDAAAGTPLAAPYSVDSLVMTEGIQHKHIPKSAVERAMFVSGLEEVGVSAGYTASTMNRFWGIGVAAKNVPAIDEQAGLVFVLAADETGAYSALTALRWSREIRSFSRVFRTLLGPGCDTSPTLSFDRRRLYCVDRAGILYAFDARSGAECWKLKLPNASSASISSAPDGRLYISIKDDILCVHDHELEGEQVWNARLGARAQQHGCRATLVNSVICLAGQHLYAVASYGDNAMQPSHHDLIALDRISGETLSMLAIEHESLCTLSMLDEKTLIVPSKPMLQGNMRALRKAGALPPLDGGELDYYGLVLYEAAP